MTTDLKIEYIAIADLTPSANNPRSHTEQQIAKLKSSIGEYGIVLPLLIDNGNAVIAGNAVLQACTELDLKSVPCVRASHLTEAQVLAYTLADNRLAEDSSWDRAKLKTEMLRLRDDYGLNLESTGFEKREILRLRMDVVPPVRDEDALPEASAGTVARLGEMWKCGPHRLICGSSTDRETVVRLLAGDQPHLMVTDPPYGVNYNPEWRNDFKASLSARTGRVLNDDKDDWREAWELFPGTVAYVWHASLHCRNVADSLEACGFALRNQIVWVKPHFALSRGDYHWQHEPCWYAVREPEYVDHDSCDYAVKGPSHWQGSRSESTVWQIGFNEDAQTTHGTQKPVKCMRRPMLNNSEPGDYIYEPFCGSGTSLIAAESCHRICLAVELNPCYVDMAVRRWQDFTGQDATLFDDGRTFNEIAQSRDE